MLDYLKIQLRNNKELESTFSPEGNIQKIKLSFEIQSQLNTGLENQKIITSDYLVKELLALMKNGINKFYTPCCNNGEYNNDFTFDDINFIVNEITSNIPFLENSKMNLLEIQFSLENSISCDVLEARNKILFEKNKIEVCMQTLKVGNNKKENRCIKFYLKINF